MPDPVVIAAGMRVLCRDAEWLVTRVQPADSVGKHRAVYCVGADDLVRGHEAIFLTQLDTIVPVDPWDTRLVEDVSQGYRKSRLFLEAQLRQMPSTDPRPDFQGMGAFQPMPYQQEAVHRALRQIRPRLLLADAVGLGKTIEVGMILTELLRRGQADRILVLTKKSMLTQFQAELWNRFTIPLVRLESVGIARLRLRIPASRNPFEVYHRIIISIDTLKDVDRYRHFLEETRWDVVVIVEAHNVAGASVPERHLSHRLARLLSRRTDSMILTTATPHNGKRATFGRLISLLDSSAIPDPKLREYQADDIKEFFLMRYKEDIRAEAGDSFAERRVMPIASTTIEASAAEEVYRTLAEPRRVSGGEGSGAASWLRDSWFQYGLYKLFLSSPEACLSTVRGRLNLAPPAPLSEAERGEREWLGRLEGRLMALSLAGSSRYRLLKQQLLEMGWKETGASPRVLIFTEYRHTQEALAAALAKDFGIKMGVKAEDQAQQAIAVIHGSMPDIHLMKTVEVFGTGNAPVRMLIATDVASEGINLHHECHEIVHYDLPWSIITLIQRNGRIDRYGQKRTPILRYLMVRTEQGLLQGDTTLFERLIAKVEEINRSTRSGESVLKLYDPEAEARYVAEQGLLAGDPDALDRPVVSEAVTEAAGLEAELVRANLEGHEDFLSFLLGETETAPAAAAAEPAEETTRLRLLSDYQFLHQGYGYLADLDRAWQPLEALAEGQRFVRSKAKYLVW